MTAITRVTEKRFWVVMYKTNMPDCHESLKSAKKEAVDFVIRNPKNKAYIFQSVHCVEGTVNIVETECE